MRNAITPRRILEFLALAALVAVVIAALAAASPTGSVRPSVWGTLKVGARLAADRGTWAGSGTLAYVYQWYRCNGFGARCTAVRGATAATYTLTATDAGKTIGFRIRATDATGTTTTYSSLAGPAAAGTVYATAAPRIAGTPETGQTLRVDKGTWAVTPQSHRYQWLRCNQNGRACVSIPRATTTQYAVAAADLGHALVARVTAQVATTRQSALSLATRPVQKPGASLPPGATPLPNGRYSVPVENIVPPARLVLVRASFSTVRTGRRFEATFTVRDTRGYAVRGALVLVVAPYGYVARVAERATDNDGDATLTLSPTRPLPSSLVLYVRARKPGDDVLAGVTAHRLVSVHVNEE